MYAKFNIHKVASFANISTISLVISTDLSTVNVNFCKSQGSPPARAAGLFICLFAPHEG